MPESSLPCSHAQPAECAWCLLAEARGFLRRVYSHYRPDEVASAPAGSQLGDWRDGMARIDAALATKPAEAPKVGMPAGKNCTHGLWRCEPCKWVSGHPEAFWKSHGIGLQPAPPAEGDEDGPVVQASPETRALVGQLTRGLPRANYAAINATAPPIPPEPVLVTTGAAQPAAGAGSSLLAKADAIHAHVKELLADNDRLRAENEALRTMPVTVEGPARETMLTLTRLERERDENHNEACRLMRERDAALAQLKEAEKKHADDEAAWRAAEAGIASARAITDALQAQLKEAREREARLRAVLTEIAGDRQQVGGFYVGPTTAARAALAQQPPAAGAGGKS